MIYYQPKISVFSFELNAPILAGSNYGESGYAGDSFNEDNTRDYEEL